METQIVVQSYRLIENDNTSTCVYVDEYGWLRSTQIWDVEGQTARGVDAVG